MVHIVLSQREEHTPQIVRAQFNTPEAKSEYQTGLVSCLVGEETYSTAEHGAVKMVVQTSNFAPQLHKM